MLCIIFLKYSWAFNEDVKNRLVLLSKKRFMILRTVQLKPLKKRNTDDKRAAHKGDTDDSDLDIFPGDGDVALYKGATKRNLKKWKQVTHLVYRRVQIIAIARTTNL